MCKNIPALDYHISTHGYELISCYHLELLSTTQLRDSFPGVSAVVNILLKQTQVEGGLDGQVQLISVAYGSN